MSPLGPLLAWWFTLLAVDIVSVLHTSAFLRLSTPPADPVAGSPVDRPAIPGRGHLGRRLVWASSSLESALSVAIVLVAVLPVGAVGDAAVDARCC